VVQQFRETIKKNSGGGIEGTSELDTFRGTFLKNCTRFSTPSVGTFTAVKKGLHQGRATVPCDVKVQNPLGIGGKEAAVDDRRLFQGY